MKIFQDIVEMDSKRTAHEKMLCITECSKNIYKAINISANIAREISEVTTTTSPLVTPTNERRLTLPTELPSSGHDPLSTPMDSEDATSAITTQPAKDNEDNRNQAESNAKKNNSGPKTIASADDYLPACIYIVLKANPTMLYSNMNFISRFAFEKRVLQGEHAYHFCSLVSWRFGVFLFYFSFFDYLIVLCKHRLYLFLSSY